MVKLGGTETTVAAAPAVSAVDAAPKLQTLANGSNVILLSEPFDKSWRKVGLALDRAELVVDDKDRASGVYFVRAADPVVEKSGLAKLAFWRKKDEVKPTRYQVTVHEGSAGCEVAASSDKGESNATSQRIIDALYKALGK
jgi:outer membrane protein assembly factor BamC